MKSYEAYDYVLPTYAIVPIINGDYSGISDDDGEKIDSFIESRYLVNMALVIGLYQT